MGFFDFFKMKSESTLEDRLNKVLLSNEMQSVMYNEVRNLKIYGDKAFRTREQNDVLEYQNALIQALKGTFDIYEFLKKNGIPEINGMILIAAFYLVNLSDVTLRDITTFSDREINNMIESFTFGFGINGEIDTSSYNKLTKITAVWLLKHPIN